ncbi:DUF1883 domain-containing protein [Paenibacillus sp. FSL P4-0338]
MASYRNGRAFHDYGGYYTVCPIRIATHHAVHWHSHRFRWSIR